MEKGKVKLEKYFYPMLCETGSEKDLGENKNKVAELKSDGTRCIIENIKEHGFRIYGKHGLTYTKTLPEITENFVGIQQTFRLDAEIVYIDNEGHQIFSGSQKRTQLSNMAKVEEARKMFPCGVFIFDIMMLNDIDFVEQKTAWIKRRVILENFVKMYSTLFGFANVRLTPYSFDQKNAFKFAIESGLEGVILKDITSPYLEGKRSALWLKVKAREHSVYILKDNGGGD